MSNPFEEDDDVLEASESTVYNSVVLEGLLCPQCLTKFSRESELLHHFNEHMNDQKALERSRSPPPQASSSSRGIRSIIGKAKKIFETDDDCDISREETNYDEFWRSQQARGPYKSHWDEFKKRRTRFMDNYVMETNRLILRLDKILKYQPANPEKRKQHEKDTVEWVEDKYVNLCPNCAKAFNFTRRKHHCRLCGGIMCHNCSQFLEYNYAVQIISPVDLETSQLTANTSKATGSSGGVGGGKDGGLQRRGSIISLPAAIPTSSHEPNIRVCGICKSLLDRRYQQMHEQYIKPYICTMYETLQKYYRDSNKLLNQYHKIIDNLRSGESVYKTQHDHAEEVKMKLQTYGEMIDLASRKIVVLQSENDVSQNGRQRQLKNRIRISATNYLHNYLFGLPPIPTQEDIEKIIEEKMRLQEIRANEAAAANRRQRSVAAPYSPMNNSSRVEAVETDRGWTPGINHISSEDIDNLNPLLVQINRIKEFIEMAKRDNRYDEASILESNLRELEIEYMTQETSAFVESQLNS